MANFSNLRKQLAVEREKLTEYTFPFSTTPDPKQRVVLQCVPAGTTNKPLTNASLKRRAAQPKVKTITAETMDEVAEVVTDLYPQFVIKGWRNVFGDDGKEVPYSVEEGQKFLRMLAEDARDYLEDWVSWAMDLDNFRAANAEQIAKN